MNPQDMQLQNSAPLSAQGSAYFTFGFDHVHVIDGFTWDKDVICEVKNADDPRQVMFDTFGPKWSMQYTEEEVAGILPLFPRGIHELEKKFPEKMPCYLASLIAERIADVEKDLEALRQAQNFASENSERFSQLPKASSFVSSGVAYIDFDRLSHSEVMRCCMTFYGKWSREADGDRLTYKLRVSKSLLLRCYQGEPPPNCRVEYEEVLVPARTERRAKFVCNGASNALTNPIQLLEAQGSEERATQANVETPKPLTTP